MFPAVIISPMCPLTETPVFTKKFLPWKLMYYEAYPTYKLAYAREYALKKRAKGWQELLKRLEIKM